MNFFESVSSAFSSIMGNKMRSILTALGIIIGVAAVIMITAIGMGFQQSVRDDFEKLGLDGLYINVRYDKEVKFSDYLKLEDCDLIKQHPNVSYVAPSFSSVGSAHLKNEEETERLYITGTNDKYRFVQNIELKHGRFLTQNDVDNRSQVIVIDENLSKKVFGRANGVGGKIKVEFWFGSVDLTVVGITKSEEYGVMFNMSSEGFVPVTTMMDLWGGAITIDTIYVMTKNKEIMDTTALELNKLLEISHNTKDVYNVNRIFQGVDTIYQVLDGITAFVGLVAFISLIVGGIGVMNIMLVTVTERTREIGIRKSLGATNGNIRFQFLVEAMILTGIGGIIGIIIGYAGAFGIGTAFKINPSIDVLIVLVSVVVSCGIGVCFGVYPAGKAAKLDPIEALRYE